ncbi:hypothetical protein TWF694_008223 [Orbilia ellipsospora]|uniref:Beta-glucuronidase C-terminal domain-containing protein n=1 Tax=Orbilia ellipsospora TaxID=2528407 RepID=A0AAV9XGP6_9PEZI
MRISFVSTGALISFTCFIVESWGQLGTFTAVNALPTLGAATAPSVDRSFVSYSIELSAITGFTSNQFLTNLFNIWASRTGALPALRVGGSGVDKSYYDPTQTVATRSVYGPNITTSYFFGPSFITNIASYFQDIGITFGLNLGDPTANWNNTVQFAVAVYQNLPQLHLFEIGNEPDLYVTNSFRSEPWYGVYYAPQWMQVAKLIVAAISPNVQFQGSVYSGPTNRDFNVRTLIGLGANNTMFKLPVYSEHFYSQSFCSARAATRVNNLINHNIIVSQLQVFPQEISAVNADNSEFIFGEANTVTCGGAPGISDTFGAALWLVDWGLTSASLDVRRVHIHSTLNTDYSMLIPKMYQGLQPGVRPMVYGMYFLAEALALPELGSDTTFMVTPISLSPNLGDISAYGLYSNRVQKPILASLSTTITQSSTTTSSSTQTLSTTVPVTKTSVVTTKINMVTKISTSSVSKSTKTITKTVTSHTVRTSHSVKTIKKTITSRKVSTFTTTGTKNKKKTSWKTSKTVTKITTSTSRSTVTLKTTSTIKSLSVSKSTSTKTIYSTLTKPTTSTSTYTTKITSSSISTSLTSFPVTFTSTTTYTTVLTPTQAPDGNYLARAIVLNLSPYNTSDPTVLNCRSCSQASPLGWGTVKSRLNTTVSLSGFQPFHTLKLLRLQAEGLNAKSGVNVSGLTLSDDDGTVVTPVTAESVIVNAFGVANFSILATEGVLLVDETIL